MATKMSLISMGMTSESTHTVYKEAMVDTLDPTVPVWKVDWKCGMDRIPVKSVPSYPFAQEQQKATKMAK